MKIKVGIMGVYGYMGGEALRVLLRHPQVELAWLTSRAPGPVSLHHPNLHGCDLHTVSEDAIGDCDVALLALPTATALSAAARLLDRGIRVIDLSAAFRLRDRAVWERLYAMPHSHWSLARQAIYGVNELHAPLIAAADLVANPGCFASAAILAFAPLLSRRLVDPERLLVTGISGTAGAGAELSPLLHHPAMANNVAAYNVVDHRHSYEIEQELSQLHDAPVSVHFTPAYAPFVRGILAICSAFPHEPLTREQLLELYAAYYTGQPFVKIVDAPAETAVAWQHRPYPQVSAVAGTNYCHIGLDIDQRRQRIVVFSVLDSLGKGGAQVAVENLNLMFGLARDSGLQYYAAQPC